MYLINITNSVKIHEFNKMGRGNVYLSSHSFEIW